MSPPKVWSVLIMEVIIRPRNWLQKADLDDAEVVGPRVDDPHLLNLPAGLALGDPSFIFWPYNVEVVAIFGLVLPLRLSGLVVRSEIKDQKVDHYTPPLVGF
jgi:hypothetical protein